MSQNPTNIKFLNTYANELSDLGSFITPIKLPDPKWLVTSNEVADLLSISTEQLNSPEFLAGLSGHSLFDGANPVAQKYTGHQFGHYNPELGDGRGILLGEISSDSGRWDLHVKGAGQTPYSRFGDGRAVVRSCVREFLASEALYHLGIPTSRALGVYTTSESVQRETLEQGAVLIRISQSHLRFGHFEYAFYQNDTELLSRLVEYSCNYVLPGSELNMVSLTEKAQALFSFAVKSTAEMVAKWQAFGFCHGVMNTDNMSILGMTFDFGPFGFLDHYEPTHICNHSDHSGRYAYDEQPGVALWNLNALGHALSPLLSTSQIEQELIKYEPLLLSTYSSLMRKKFGFTTEQQQDRQILGEFLALMQRDKSDYTNTWRLLSNLQVEVNEQSFIDHFISRDIAAAWLNKYKGRLELEQSDELSRMSLMKANNPKYILRNYLAQEAIKAVEEGDNSKLDELFQVLKKPFDEQNEYRDYAKLPPDWSKQLAISCSS